MTLIPGVEINALVTRDLGLWEWELHILGFGMDPDDEAFEAALSAGSEAPAGRGSIGRSRCCARSGCRSMPRSQSSSSDDDDALGRPTIARALIAGGFASSVEDAFSRIIGHGGPGLRPT